MMIKVDCMIVGAGIAGLLAGKTLQEQGHTVYVLDKGYYAGGRLSTRRSGEVFFDAGAQFFTVRHAEFQRWIDQWLDAGIVTEWARGFQEIDGHPRYRGVPHMRSIGEHLAQSLTVHTRTQVTTITSHADRWHITTHANIAYEARALILTPPVPQSLALLDADKTSLSPSARQALEQIMYAPCLALLLELDRPTQMPATGAVQLDSEPIRWLADNYKKGVSPIPSVTIHAASQYSWENYKAEDAGILVDLVDVIRPWLGDAQITHSQIKRWQYSQPTTLHPKRCLYLTRPLPVAFAGDAFFEPRVEGAALSGLTAAKYIHSSLQ